MNSPTAGLISEPSASWWFGIYTDHLYENCPARRRTVMPTKQRIEWDKQGAGTVDPLGTDICGWCRRVWIARNPDYRPD